MEPKYTCGYVSGRKNASNLTTQMWILFDIRRNTKRDAPHGHDRIQPELQPTDADAHRQATYQQGYITMRKHKCGDCLRLCRRMGGEDQRYFDPLSAVGGNVE